MYSGILCMHRHENMIILYQGRILRTESMIHFMTTYRIIYIHWIRPNKNICPKRLDRLLLFKPERDMSHIRICGRRLLLPGSTAVLKEGCSR